MKKFLIFIVAVFALCSCTKDEENYTGIPDGTYVEDMSRYSVYDLNQIDPKILTINGTDVTLDFGNNIKIYGYYEKIDKTSRKIKFHSTNSDVVPDDEIFWTFDGTKLTFALVNNTARKLSFIKQ